MPLGPFFKVDAVCPRFHMRHRTRTGFVIPAAVKLQDGDLAVPKIGWTQLQGANPYHGHKPLQARILQEGTPMRPQWYVDLTYAIP